VDTDFLKTFGIRMAAGRDFSKSFPADAEGGVILNETAVREIGWKEPLGKRIDIVRPQRVIGVVSDFHFQSLHVPIGPLALFIHPAYYQNLTVRIQITDTAGIIKTMAGIWRRLVPGQAFSYSFLAEEYDRLYKADIRLGQVLGIATFIALLIASLGLFGLAVFSTSQRTKEIGIRKALGATISEITFLLSREFLKWVVIAALIAWPLAYFFMNRWLQTFAYRTTIGFGIFFFSALVALAITLLTVGYHSIRAARRNPVDSLHYE
jgi:putative ABC transport system permease protein